MEIVLVEYNLYDMDKQLQLEELESDNIFSNNDEDDVKIKNEEKLNKILYYYLKNNEHKEDNVYKIFKDGGAELIKKGNKYEFILEYPEISDTEIYLYINDNSYNINTDLIAEVKNIVQKDISDPYYEVYLKISYLDNISLILEFL